MLIILFGAGVECQVRLHFQDSGFPGTFGSYLSCRLAWAAGVSLGFCVAGGASGAHLNPAITVALAILRGFSKRKVAPYVISQILGCMFGALVVYALYTESIYRFDQSYDPTVNVLLPSAGMFITGPNPVVSLGTAYLTEFVATATLVLLIFAFADPANVALGPSSLPLGLFFSIYAIGSALGSNVRTC